MAVRIEMDMPKCCDNCRFAVQDCCSIEYCCAIDGEEIFPVSFDCKNKRLDNCPLKEIK